MPQTVAHHPQSHPRKGLWHTEQLSGIGPVALAPEQTVHRLLGNSEPPRLRVPIPDGAPRRHTWKHSDRTFGREDFAARGRQALFAWDKEQTRRPLCRAEGDLFPFALPKTGESPRPMAPADSESVRPDRLRSLRRPSASLPGRRRPLCANILSGMGVSQWGCRRTFPLC